MIEEDLLQRVVEEYNKYHGAEARVKFLKQCSEGRDRLLVQFRGPFCLSCAPDEYCIDFLILLEQATGLKFKISSVVQDSDETIVNLKYENS